MNLGNLLLPLLLLLMLGFLFMSFRKQKKQVSAAQEMQANLTAGANVMTTTGLYGTVVAVAEETIDLEIAPGVTTTWLRRAIAKVITPEPIDAPSLEKIDPDDLNGPAERPDER